MTVNLNQFSKAVAYYRVSTNEEKQRYGIQGQIDSVTKFAQRNNLELLFHDGDVPQFVEYETGTNKRQRPIMQAAIQSALDNGAVLLIAKLDRLARNVHFISGLMESGVNFVAVDMPQIDSLTIHILAAVAEQEAKLISQRTKAGLRVAKSKGVELGTPENLTDYSRKRSAQVRSNNARNYYQQHSIDYIVLNERKNGRSWRDIATVLNDRGLRTIRGNEFNHNQAKRVYEMFAI